MNTKSYAHRIDELESLCSQLQTRSGDLGPLVGRLLEAAGDLFRRTQTVPCERSAIVGALKQLPVGGLKSWSEAVSLDDLSARLHRAADEAVEAALPDSTEDGATWHSWAMQGLLARDRLESALWALSTLSAEGRADATVELERFRGGLEKVDRALKRKAMWFGALNPERRAEAALLDTQARDDAWWFCERTAEADDGIVKALGGEGDAVLDAAAKEVDALVRLKRSRVVSGDELYRYDLGVATVAEKAAVASYAQKNSDFARAVAALQDAEHAIEEATRPAGQSVASAPQPSEASRDIQLVEDRPEFKVLLFRKKQNIAVVVQPKRLDRFAAAAVFLPDAPELSRPSRPTAEGIEFDLGPRDKVSGQRARVVVRLTSGSPVTCEVVL